MGLTLISVPIGNLEDITIRAFNLLKNHKYFIVEDTRSFRSLLSHLKIEVKDKKIISFYDNADPNKLKTIIRELKSGIDYLFASEAGSPIISDPAYPIVQEALAADIEIKSIPGVSSLIVALELSGLPPNPFHFCGFLPRGDRDKYEVMQSFHYGTNIFFESPHRVQKSLSQLVNIWPKANIVLARELTKKFETVYRFNASDFESIRESITEKGECVVLVHITREDIDLMTDNIAINEIQKAAMEYLNKGGKRSLSKLLAKILNKSSKEIYKEITS